MRLLGDLDPEATAIVDTAGAALAAVIGGPGRGADLVKPSQRELAELVGWSPRPSTRSNRRPRRVAGIAAGLARGDDHLSAVRPGVAAGTATVLTPRTGLFNSDVVEPFVERMTVTAAR